MKVAVRTWWVVLAVLAASNGLVLAQANSQPDAYLSRTNRSLLKQGDKLALITAEASLVNGIKMLTNGTYCVGKSNPFPLTEGQLLRTDGFLLNPDGTIFPVYDHIVMSGAQVMVFKDGVATPISQPLRMPDGAIINPDGTYSKGIRSARLVDGQMLTPDGQAINRFDTIIFRGGLVVVFKSGALIQLQNRQVIMGMYDGSKVRGDGQITYPDGTIGQMTDGQILVVEGVRPTW